MSVTRLLLPLALFAGLAAVPARALPAPSPFPVRAVKLTGSLSDPRVLEHLDFAVSLGFNAVWIYSHEAGRWADAGDGRRPELDPAFVEVARRCRERGVRILVSVNPPADTGGRFLFSEPEGERRIRSFFRLLRRKAGVSDLVLSFDDQPTRLRQLRDVLRYGKSTAPAHLDLARRIARRLPRGSRLWLCASTYSDVHLGDGKGLYAAPFLAGLPALPPRVGIVWTGSAPISPAVGAAALRRARFLLGGRDLLLYDNFSPIEGGENALAAYLGPLRDREPGLAAEAAIYMASPLSGPGVSRLPLLTAADYLADPGAYDADRSLRSAIERLAGPAPRAREALSTQALEWRGWEGGRPFRPWDPASPEDAASALDDPALVAAWEWTVRRYPERMAALRDLDDREFRDALLEIMERRLAVARTAPLAVEYLARRRAGRADLEPILDAVREERRRAAGRGTSLRALDAFLAAAGVPAPPL